MFYSRFGLPWSFILQYFAHFVVNVEFTVLKIKNYGLTIKHLNFHEHLMKTFKRIKQGFPPKSEKMSPSSVATRKQNLGNPKF